MKKYLQMLAILLLAFLYQIEGAYSLALTSNTAKGAFYFTGSSSDYCRDDKDEDGKSDHDHDHNGKGDGCDDDDHDHDNKNKHTKKNYCDEDKDEDGKNDHDHDHDGKGDGCDDDSHQGDDANHEPGKSCSTSQPRPITGNQHPCPGDIEYYSIQNTRGYTSFVWDVPRAQAGNPPAGWEILEGQGTNRVKVRVGEKSGTMKVKVTDPFCGTKVATLPIKPGKDFEVTLSGPAQLCVNELQEYRASVNRNGNGNGNGNKKGEFQYTWTVPSGWVIVEGQGTEVIKVKAGSTDGDVSVSVKDNTAVSGNGNNGNGVGGYKQGYCGIASDRIRVITKEDCGSPAPTCPSVVITGPESVCVNQEQVFTANLQNANWDIRFAYTWNVPAGWRITKGQGTHSITVIPGNTQGQVSVNVYDANCQENDDDSDYCDDDDDHDGKDDHDHDRDGKGDKCDDDDHDHDDKDKKGHSNYCNDDNDRDGRKDHDHDHDGKGDKCDDDDHKADKKDDKKRRTDAANTDSSNGKNKSKSNYCKEDKDRDGKGDHDHDHDGKSDDCDDDDHDSKDKNKKGRSNYCNDDNDRDGRKDHDHDRDGKGDKCDDDDHRGDDRDDDGNCDDDDEDEDTTTCCSVSAVLNVSIKANCGTTPTCPTPIVSVSGPDSVCAFQDEPVTFTANVTGTTDLTTYIWTVSGDSEILSGQGTASIQVQVGSEGGQVSVSVANACGTKASNTHAMVINEDCGGVITPLPVELISFEGEATKSGVLLEWATAMEKNNDRFEVERSADGASFTKIAEVKGNGTTSVKRTYSLRDAKANRGTHYYRLKQVDFDGSSEYSKMIVVENSTAAAAAILVAPNPANGQFTIALDNAEGAQLQILDMNGRLVHTQSLSQGARELNFNTSTLGMRSGMYLISIKSAAGSSQAKLVVR
jgi:hypothetical protein